MAKIYRVIQIKLNQLVSDKVHMVTDLPTKRFKRYRSDRHFSYSFTYKMTAEIDWHIYGTKLRHCHPVCITALAISMGCLLVV